MERLAELLNRRDALYQAREKARKTMKEKDKELEALDRDIFPFLTDGQMITSPNGYIYRKVVELVYSGREVNEIDDPATPGGFAERNEGIACY